MDIYTKRLARKAQSIQGCPISFPNCRVVSLKVIYFQSIFLIDFYIKRLIYMQEYGINFTKFLCSREFKRKQKLQ